MADRIWYTIPSDARVDPRVGARVTPRSSAPAPPSAVRELAVELPVDRRVRRQLLLAEREPEQRDRHRALAQDLVVERLLRHLPRVHDLAAQPAELERAEEVRRLVERPVPPLEGAQHLRARVRALVPGLLHEVVHRLLRRPLPHVELEGEDDPRA